MSPVTLVPCPRSTPLRYRLGIDVGGTFTDYALHDLETGRLTVGKHPTRPSDIASGVFEGLESVRGHRPISEMRQIVHATTIASNLMVERKGAVTGLLTTRGFRDVLLIQRQLRVNIYDLFLDKVQPLLLRRFIREVDERMTHSGEVYKRLDEDSVVEAVKTLMALGVETFAVSLLHSYANPTHEHRVRDIILDISPSASVTLSSDISPQWREYERTSTAVANAYLMPAVRGYLERFRVSLQAESYARPLQVMQANGGTANVEVINRAPVRLIESGPAAGALMAASMSRALRLDHVISFDMGGTTAKVCLIEEGSPSSTAQIEIDRMKMQAGSGLPISVPGIDLVEIGAGGGSVARVELGAIAVGPDSAGASPGPICYGAGGAEPTVTDADLVLGYLNPDYFLGGRMSLDKQSSEKGISERISNPLGLTVQEGAWGIHTVVNANMRRALRLATVERGKDPRRYTLVGFGGAGPVHACRLARELGIGRVLLPAGAGVGSAAGLLAADTVFDLARTYDTLLEESMLAPVNAVFEELLAGCQSLMHENGVTDNIEFSPSADMHYEGQGFDLEVPIPRLSLDESVIPELKEVFHQKYADTFGYAQHDQPIRAVGWKLRASHSRAEFQWSELEPANWTPTPSSRRPAYFPESGGFVDTPVYARPTLGSGASISGPAIVEEAESTVVLLPGSCANVDRYGNILVEFQQ